MGLVLASAVVVLAALLVAIRTDDGTRGEVLVGTAGEPAEAEGSEAEGETGEGPPPQTDTRPQLGVIAVQSAGEGAPILVEVTADAMAGRITLRFDRAVEPGQRPHAEMGLIVYGGEPSCPMPSGNGQRIVDGAGTETVVLEATSLQPGISYITLNPGVVTGAESGEDNARVGCTAVDAGAPSAPMFVAAIADGGPGEGGGTIVLSFSRAVKMGDATRLTVYSDTGCRDESGAGTAFLGAGLVPPPGAHPNTGVASDGKVTIVATGLAPGTAYVVLGAGVVTEPFAGLPNATSSCTPVTVTTPPVLLSATGDAGLGQVTLRFSRPVVGGDQVLQAMRVLVHGADSACRALSGNAHVYLAGQGTDTITVDATSLVAGTTYISVISGFVTSVDDGTPNRTARCVPVRVAG